MRFLPMWLILLLGANAAWAQVDVELLLEQDQFLRDEPVPVRVKITNRSGQTLRLGEDDDWITFNVEIPGRGPVEKSGRMPLASPFELESARTATREINVQPWFEISMPSRYAIAATVRIKQWSRELTAKSKPFEIVRGAKLWEQQVGVPGLTTATGEPQIRRFVLQQANYKSQLKLYVRVSNEADTYAFSVQPLGPAVSFGQPEAQVDQQSILHVLFQTGARSFQYAQVTTAGNVSVRQTYDYTATRPTLRLNDLGKFAVVGGVRRVTASDLPAAAPTSTTVPPSTDKDVVAPAPK